MTWWGWGNRDNYHKATENGSHKDGVTELTDFQRWLRKGQEGNIKDETMLMRVEPGEGLGEGKRTTGLKIKQQKEAREKSRTKIRRGMGIEERVESMQGLAMLGKDCGVHFDKRSFAGSK